MLSPHAVNYTCLYSIIDCISMVHVLIQLWGKLECLFLFVVTADFQKRSSCCLSLAKYHLHTFQTSLTFAQKCQIYKYLSVARTLSASVNLDILRRSFLSVPIVEKGVCSWTKKQRCRRKTRGQTCHLMKRMEKS